MKNNLLLLLFALFAFLAQDLRAEESLRLSQDPDDRRSTIPHDPLIESAVKDSDLDLVVVNFEGWRETLPSFARLKLYEITGRTRISGQDATYSILSMIYQPELWYDARILPVEHPDLLTRLNLDDKWVSPRQVIENERVQPLLTDLQHFNERKAEAQRLTDLLNAVEQVHRLGREDRVLRAFLDKGVQPEEITSLLDDREMLRTFHDKRQTDTERVERERPFYEAADRLLHRARAIAQLPEALLLIPDPEAIDNRWVRPAALGATETYPLAQQGNALNSTLHDAFTRRQPDLIQPAVVGFLELAEKSRQYPPRAYRQLTNYYVTWNPWRLAAGVYLLGAIAFGLHLFFRSTSWYWAGLSLMVMGFFFHTAAVAIRLYLTGHVPVSNMFESITFCSWAVLILAFAFEAWHRKGLVPLGAMILGFLFLTGAGLMPLHQTRLHPLRAVLNSYWLNIHVTMMLVSYAAFAIAAFFALLYLVRSILGREALFGTTPVITQPQTEEFAYRVVQVGWPILTFGITLGAVWADTAWGRYWGWDPKETWAFITWVAYTVYLHTRMVMGWRGRWSAAACLLGFIMVMITWWGVSYLPWFSGGLHSYASPR